MRLKSRLRKLELIVAPPPPACDCPWPVNQYELPNGTLYPPVPPCLRGRCPAIFLPGDLPTIQVIAFCNTNRTRDEPHRVGWEVGPDAFRVWDPETDRPRLRVLVWRDKDRRLRYHGPPRWWELAVEVPRIIKGIGVPENDEVMIEELRRTDDTPPLGSACYGRRKEWDKGQ
jgi:hypothetical protein